MARYPNFRFNLSFALGVGTVGCVSGLGGRGVGRPGSHRDAPIRIKSVGEAAAAEAEHARDSGS